MRSARLSLALETGLLTLPSEGTIAVYRPRTGDDLSDLPRDRVRVLTGFRPDADWFAARGYTVNPPKDGLPHAAAIVCLPRSREGAQALIARAEAEVGGEVVEAELEDERGGPVYEIKLLTRAGRLVKVRYDARTGAALPGGEGKKR